MSDYLKEFRKLQVNRVITPFPMPEHMEETHEEGMGLTINMSRRKADGVWHIEAVSVAGYLEHYDTTPEDAIKRFFEKLLRYNDV